MSTRILVPLDGSARAESALPVAARIARASGAALVQVQVATIPAILDSAAPVSCNAEVLAQVIDEAGDYLKTVAQERALSGVRVLTVALYGAVAQTILAVASTYQCDLIVMTSRGRTGARRWLLGSVAHKVVRSSPVPVLVLQERGFIPPGNRPDGGPVRALVTLDGSVPAKAALEPAARLVTALAFPGRGTLHLLRVVKTLPIDGQKLSAEEVERLQDEAMRKARSYVRAVARHLQVSRHDPPPLSITWSVASGDDIAQAIIDAAENGRDAKGAGPPGRCDLIAMATHGRSGPQRGVLGSVTERVLSAARLPLLIARPSEMDARRAIESSVFAATEML
jgi:nucleotide-binding universal stress UspA family protein